LCYIQPSNHKGISLCLCVCVCMYALKNASNGMSESKIHLAYITQQFVINLLQPRAIQAIGRELAVGETSIII
uniref:Uncharacterized protein n=1 Tax=Naja naja TaxID=35670 RepID=A0A8C6X8V6_NAJNA